MMDLKCKRGHKGTLHSVAENSVQNAGREVGYYLVKIKDSIKLNHESNSYQPDPHGYAPMYWDGSAFINYDELIWQEEEVIVGKHFDT